MAKDKPPAFQFYPDSWLSSTSILLMSPAEEGAYIRLLSHAWMADDCGLPNDDAQLAVLSRLGKQWSKSGHRIRGKFDVIGDRLFNQRLVEERVKQQEWRRKSSEGGRLSAATKAQAKVKGGSRVVDEWLQPNVKSRVEEEEEDSSEDLKPKKEASKTQRPPLAAMSKRFLDFWERHPGKKLRQNLAAGVWAHMVTIDNEDACFTCLDRYLASQEVANRAFMNPETWLSECVAGGFTATWPPAKARENGKLSPQLSPAMQRLSDEVNRPCKT